MKANFQAHFLTVIGIGWQEAVGIKGKVAGFVKILDVPWLLAAPSSLRASEGSVCALTLS